MKAMILAAGLGTRLYPLTEDRTKPAIPFLNRPLIAYSVEYLASFGIRDIIINLHYQPDSIRQPLGDGSQFGARISYSFEEEILGPAGAFDRVRDQLMDDDFIVINGKIVTDIDLHAAVSEHRERQAIATLVLKENRRHERFSIVEVDERGYIARFAGFPQPLAQEAAALSAREASAEDAEAANLLTASANPQGASQQSDTASPVSAALTAAPLMFVGIHVLSPRIFAYVPRNCYSDSIKDVYPQAMRAGEAVIAHVASGNWYEMSTIDRYLESSLLFLRKEGKSVISGRNCRVAEDATVTDAVLWEDVIVESGARVHRAVLGDGVRIAAGAVVENAAVVRADRVSKFERGEVIGDNLIVRF